jgi:hypothetical protein
MGKRYIGSVNVLVTGMKYSLTEAFGKTCSSAE